MTAFEFDPGESHPAREADLSTVRGTGSTHDSELEYLRREAVETKHFCIDDCKKYDVAIRVDSERGLAYATLTNQNPALRSDDSRLDDMLTAGITVKVGGAQQGFDRGSGEVLGSVALPLEGGNGKVSIEIALAGQPMRTFSYDPESNQLTLAHTSRTLRAYDMRNLEMQGEKYLETWTARNLEPTYRPIVDLHTHFGGQVSSEGIVAAALRIDAKYPVELLRSIGIEPPAQNVEQSRGQAVVSLRALPPDDISLLKAAMHIEPTQVITFENMELVYKLRGPIAKNLDVFPELLMDTARGHRERGVQYTELSISDIVDPKWLAKAHECLPAIEAETGVKLRFVVGLWRHNPEEFNIEMVEKVKFAASVSPYVVGADFMGHETNSTLAFRDVISSKDQWTGKTLTDPRTGELRSDGLLQYREKHPHFQIRVHAGENAVNPENVREAILAGATRIGHGLYGLDGATLKLAVDRGVVIEFNFNSNRALNNVEGTQSESAQELPIKHYFDAGTKVTFGTDGAIYQGGGKAETYIGVMAGMTHADLLKVARSDLAYKQTMDKAFVEEWNAMVDRCIDTVVVNRMAGDPPLGPVEAQALREELVEISAVGRRGPIYTKAMTPEERVLWPEFEQRVLKDGSFGLPDPGAFPVSTFDWKSWEQARTQQREKLSGEIEARQIVVWPKDQLEELLGGRTPILVSGASASSWPKITDKEAVRSYLRELVASSDPDQVVFVTGATAFGVEEELHQIVKAVNADRALHGEPQFRVLGTVVDETKSSELGPITDAVFMGDRWYAKSGPVLEFVKASNGVVIFVGGGNILNDEIQAARNVKVDFYLMRGPEGASTTKANTYGSHAFDNFEGFEKLVRERRGD